MKNSLVPVALSALFSIVAGSAALAQTPSDANVTVNPAALPQQPATTAPLPPVHLRPPPASAPRAADKGKTAPAAPHQSPSQPPEHGTPAPQAAPQGAAAARPAPKAAVERGLAKLASILFDSGSASLSSTGHATIKDSLVSLKTALANDSQRVEVIGYGGDPGDTSSNARRLSLERALAVRQALMGDGVPPERIDVRALGGGIDSGTTERVDVFIKN